VTKTVEVPQPLFVEATPNVTTWVGVESEADTSQMPVEVAANRRLFAPSPVDPVNGINVRTCSVLSPVHHSRQPSRDRRPYSPPIRL
jgi:hypothetical protein